MMELSSWCVICYFRRANGFQHSQPLRSTSALARYFMGETPMPLTNDIVNNMPFDIGQPHIASAKAKRRTRVVYAK